jgi:hypothetical protein
MLKEIKETIIEVYKKAIFISSVPLVVGIILKDWYFILGLFLGISSGMFNFYLLSLKAMATLNSSKFSYFFLFSNYIFRYIIMGIILIIAVKIKLNTFIGASIGLILIPVGIYFGRWENKKSK